MHFKGGDPAREDIPVFPPQQAAGYRKFHLPNPHPFDLPKMPLVAQSG